MNKIETLALIQTLTGDYNKDHGKIEQIERAAHNLGVAGDLNAERAILRALRRKQG